MKRVIALLLALVMMLSFAACAGKKNDETQPESEATESVDGIVEMDEETEAETDEDLEAELETETAADGSIIATNKPAKKPVKVPANVPTSGLLWAHVPVC